MDQLITPINLTNELISANFESGEKTSLTKIKELYSSLTVYGSVEYPLFLENDVRKKLNMTKTIRLKNMDENDMVKIYVEDANGIERTKNAFTERGFYKVLGTSKNIYANEWWNLTYIVFKHLRQHGQVTLKNIIRDKDNDIRQLNESIAAITKDYKQSKINYTCDLQEQKAIANTMESEKHQALGQLVIIKRDMDINKSLRDEYVGNSDICLDEFRKAYMFRIYVYIVNLTDHKNKYNGYDLNYFDEYSAADMEGDNLRYVFVSTDVPKFPACIEYKFIKIIYVVDSGIKLLLNKLYISDYVKTIKHLNGKMYKYPVFEVSMSIIEEFISTINKDSIAVRIIEREKKQTTRRKEKILKDVFNMHIKNELKQKSETKEVDIINKK